MENNEGHGKLPPSGSNIELEKFKRRLIRAVARMLLHEKRNENEVWAGLRKETGCDCKELWGRMHALTIKKLDRLLKVQDRVDLLPKAARMSITDWLMFDRVLVHEEFDVIGMTETTAEDKKILVDLFDLVEKYTIEFLAGEELTDAWLKVTLEYNKDGRQCTPMLLQRRWYQLKLATRARFYKFWSMYKGIVKRQYLGEPFKPTALQAKIALRYKPLVVKPFMLWEELVKNNLVVLPESFERKENIKSANSNEIDPDVMCVEPVVEIIDLDAESDLELEYRKTAQNNQKTQIVIKQEPKDKNELDIDENAPYENRQEKILHFAEAAMEATAMELDEIELADDIDGFLSPNPGVEVEIPLNEHTNKDQNPDNTYLQGDSVLPIVDDENNEAVVTENACKANLVNISEANGGLVIGHETSSVFENGAEEQPLVEDVEAENNDIEMQKEQEPVLPQITSVFGGVDVSSETLSKIGLLTAQISNCANKTILENKHEPEVESATSIPLNNDSSDDLIFVDDAKPDEDEDTNKDASAYVKTIDSKLNRNVNTNPDITKSNWFGDLANDIDFADDGIQLVDDGIAYIDDESEYQMPEIKTELKTVIKIEEHEAVLDKVEEDEPKVDEKLLMVPIVNMLKLDDMGILPIHMLNHIDSKCLIDIIISKNNPIKKKVRLSEPIKEEINTSYPIKKEADDSESSDEDVVDDVKRVKLSSILLQKPRCRTYNPIQLCKNPDFNTRLKKLNVGFFSSARNRLLLKSCKPLSIDVSKAFEHKLVNGTVYLEMSDSEDLHKDTEPEENNQNVSVIPSAMAVQSLIDNTRGDIPPVSYSPIAPKPAESALLTCERNKIINLPDISEIRRINQKLLTAEVTPLQLKSGSTQVPVTLVTAANIESNPSHVYTKYFKAGPASRKKLMQSQVVDITKEDNTGKDDSHTKNVAGNKDSLKTINKLPPWKPRHKPEVPWYSNKNSIYAEDTLLALDSLNKMLYLITEGDGTLPVPSGKGNKGKRKGAMRKEMSTVKPLLKDVDNDDVQVVSEIKLDNAEAKKSRKGKIVQSNSDKKQKLLYCCWARERICQLIFSKRQITKHNCPFPLCLCCCKTALVEFIRKKEEVSNPKKPTGALPLGDITSELSNTGTEDVTFISENRNISADVAEIIPIKEKTAEISTSDSPSCKEDKVNEIITIESEVNTDTVVCGDDSTQEVVTQMTQENSSDVTIGAEISVTTSESTVTIDSKNTSTTKTDIIPIVKPKPLIRVRAAPGSRKTADTNLRKKIVQEQSSRVQQSRHLVLTQSLEVVEKGIADDLAKPFRIREISPETLPKQFLNSTVANVLPKTHSNQKMIYLNSKQISELPSDNPIFLGKNKILLTTAIFPPNFKAFEAFQANIRQTLALPKGIQLLLLPSGRLTYIRDRKIDVNEEFMASLPLLITAIQQQINGSVAQPVENCSVQTEVIDLSGDETTGAIENIEKQSEVAVSEDNVDQTKSSEKLHTENTEEIRSDDIPTVNLEETKTTESAANVNTQSDVITPESAITPEAKENSGKFNNILSDLMAMSGIVPTDVTSTSKECLSPVKTLEELPTANVEEVSSQITDCKNLPVQSIQHSINPPLLQPINSTLEQNSSLQLVHTSKDDNDDKTEPSINKVMTKSLTPITSLSELKYACAQSGLFFKLDLDTGLLVPINVCMKKFTDSSQRRQHYVRKLSNALEPKPIIDLTDDDVSEIPAITQAQLVSNLAASQSTEHPDENVGNNIQGTSNVDKSTSSSDLDVTYEVVNADSESIGTSSCNVDPRISGNNVNKDGEVKPLKLYKSSVGRPTILERKLKEIQKRIFDAKLTQDMVRRKLKRKQEFESLIRVVQPNSEKLDERVSSDDSSDEEPLAKIATKIRAAEKAGTESNENVSETAVDENETDLPANSRLYMEVENIHKLPDAIDEPMDDEPNVDLPMEEDEDIECLDETILNEDEPEEYCILGV